MPVVFTKRENKQVSFADSLKGKRVRLIDDSVFRARAGTTTSRGNPHPVPVKGAIIRLSKVHTPNQGDLTEATAEGVVIGFGKEAGRVVYFSLKDVELL